MNFSDTLKSLRAQAQLSQTEFAKIIGVSRSCIGMYETGQREPDFETLETIADYFNVTMDYLLGKTNIPNEAAKKIVGNLPNNDKKTTTLVNVFTQLSEDGKDKVIDYSHLILNSEQANT